MHLCSISYIHVNDKSTSSRHIFQLGNVLYRRRVQHLCFLEAGNSSALKAKDIPHFITGWYSATVVAVDEPNDQVTVHYELEPDCSYETEVMPLIERNLVRLEKYTN